MRPFNRHQAKRAWKTFDLITVIRAQHAAISAAGTLVLAAAKPPVAKPHGRRAWKIDVWGSYFDFGVMPRLVGGAVLT